MTTSLSLAQILEIMLASQQPMRFTAYDGSAAGPEDAALGLDLVNPRGTTYLATAPGELGLVRAYVSGDLEFRGVHPGDPYELLAALNDRVEVTRPSVTVLADIVRSIGVQHLVPIAPPPQETPPPWRRAVQGLRHSRSRDAEAISPPLRRLQHLLRVGSRTVDDLHLRLLPGRRRDAGGGAGEQVPAGVRQAPAAAGRPAPRRRLRVGKHGALRRPSRRPYRRDHLVPPSRRPGPRRRSPRKG